MSFEIHVDLSSLQPTSGNENTIGQIFVRVGGAAFPDEQWWDFPCVILGWWLRELHDPSSEFVLRFMDGPALLMCSLDGPTVMVDALTTTATSSSPVASTTIGVERMRGEITRAATGLAAECERLGLPYKSLGLK